MLAFKKRQDKYQRRKEIKLDKNAGDTKIQDEDESHGALFGIVVAVVGFAGPVLGLGGLWRTLPGIELLELVVDHEHAQHAVNIVLRRLEAVHYYNTTLGPAPTTLGSVDGTHGTACGGR